MLAVIIDNAPAAMRVCVCAIVPSSPCVSPGDAREVSHVLTLWFQGEPGLASSSGSSLTDLDLVKFKLAPACVDISDLVLENEGSAEGLACMVSSLGACRLACGAQLSGWGAI